jgi:hypothetical protein
MDPRIRIRTKMSRIRNTELYTEIGLNGTVGSYAAVPIVQYRTFISVETCKERWATMSSDGWLNTDGFCKFEKWVVILLKDEWLCWQRA